MRFGNRKLSLEPELEEQRALLERGARILGELGLEVLPYRDPSLPVLRAKPDAAPGIAYLRAYCDVLEEMVRAGESPRDNPKLLWRYLRRIGLRPEADIFGHLEADSVVEIYTLDHLQIFRNLKFFEFSSFSVEEVVHCNWSKVARRNAYVTLRLLGLAVKIKAGLIRRTVDTSHLGEHVVEETIGEKNRFFLQVRYISPLMNDPGDRSGPGVRGILAVNRVRF